MCAGAWSFGEKQPVVDVSNTQMGRIDAFCRFNVETGANSALG